MSLINFAKVEPKDRTAKDVSVQRSKGKHITIPEGMSFKEGATWLLEKDAEDERVVAVNHEIDCFPLDGAVAFRKALGEIYGFVKDVPIPGSFFEPERPPLMVGVPVSTTETIQVPWGRVQVPGVVGFLETGLHPVPFPKFRVTGQIKQRHKEEVLRIVEKTRELLKSESIYKGQAVRLDLSWLLQDPSGRNFDPCSHAPKFIDMNGIHEEDLVLSRELQAKVDLGLFTPIECTLTVRANHVPLKRGVLLAGEYGTGKTLTAYVTAKKAVDNGWTFIYLSNVMHMALGMRFAVQYGPAVLFVEDVDRVAGSQIRTEQIDAILNQMDGVDTKGTDLMVVATTNHIENLTQALLRPGRFDTQVEFTRPDRDAAARIVRRYGRETLSDDCDFAKIGGALDGYLPAEIREAVELAKLAAINRLHKSNQLTPGQIVTGMVMEDDVLNAVYALQDQHTRLLPKAQDSRSIPEKVADMLGDRIADAIECGVERNAAAAFGLLQAAGVVRGRDMDEMFLSHDHDVSQPAPVADESDE